jgi:hypothetical protein
MKGLSEWSPTLHHLSTPLLHSFIYKLQSFSSETSEIIKGTCFVSHSLVRIVLRRVDYDPVLLPYKMKYLTLIIQSSAGERGECYYVLS